MKQQMQALLFERFGFSKRDFFPVSTVCSTCVWSFAQLFNLTALLSFDIPQTVSKDY
jgi:hypothetical protein